MKSCILAGGCFWCMAKPYYEYDGIINVYSGYSGGDEINPTYEEVKQQKTHHLECVKLVYDPNIINYIDILNIYFDTIDPFDDGGQFIDRGKSYQLAVFYQDEVMKNTALNIIIYLIFFNLFLMNKIETQRKWTLSLISVPSTPDCS